MLTPPTGPSETYFVIEEFEFSRGALGFPGGLDSEESAFNARDMGFIPGLGRSPGEGNGTHSSVLTWRLPWTVGPGGLQSMGWQRVRHD